MIWILLVAHLVGVAAVLSLPNPRFAFAAALVAPAVTTIWALTRLGDATVDRAGVTWVEGLDLALNFRVGPFGALLAVLVSGIGVLVFVYGQGYFGGGDRRGFAATLLAFSGSMLGLVWSDDVWTLFLFWEATSVTSFLLVGTKSSDEVAVKAARRALLITVAGGLVLLAGLLVLVDATGTATLSEMGPVTGDQATVAAVLVLIGAATKSAQLPFHVWLPGAMAAPTPVSAYLHSATMVKAGIVLVGIMHPVLGDVGIWQGLGATVGLLTMLWGAIGALRHADAKLVLAWGTVSQLGLMTAMMALGSGKAIFAGVSLVVAHALFKAALFMVVGEIDVRTGSRDIRTLSGLRRSMPMAFWVMVLAGLSMAGVPPLLGFPAKEAAIEAGLGESGATGDLVLLGVVVGSILTVAYTTRLVVALFSDKGGEPTEVAPWRPAAALPSVFLAVAGVVGYLAAPLVTDWVVPAAVTLEEASSVYELLRWPGFKPAFWISMGVVASGAVIGVAAARRSSVPEPVGAANVDRLVDRTLDLARWTTGRVQHGSLPIYLVVMALVATLAVTPLLGSIDGDELYAWDRPLQAGMGAAVVAAAIAVAVIRSRIGAALALGVVGVGVSALFLIQGAPDLALTQLLVETVIVVAFVIGLGRLTTEFPSTGAVWRSVRIGAGLLAGAAVTVALLASAEDTPSNRDVLTEAAVEEGGGNNL
ncbi:MAG: proton-conducting transporter membrane subunit, partial [Actinomycetota bacterium]